MADICIDYMTASTIVSSYICYIICAADNLLSGDVE